MRSLFDQRRGLWHRGALQIGLAVLGAALVSGVAAAAPARMAAPPVNGKIAFQTHRANTNEEIYVMNANGSHQTDVTNTPSSDESSPAWSPDGTKIAYARGGDIWVMNADGTGQTQITTIGGAGDPAWSPDGTRIAFSSGLGGADVYVTNADGSGSPTDLTNDTSHTDLSPAWSPDGTKIAYQYSHLSYDDIYVMNADGTDKTALTTDSYDGNPDWSPDGTKIAFTRSVGGIGGNSEIYVMNADGSDPTDLTNNAAADEYPVWSPDGKKIVFTSFRSANLDIYSMNADGSGQMRLTTNSESDAEPDWQPVHVKLPVKAFFPVYFAGGLLKLEQFSVDPAAGLVVDVEVVSGGIVVYTGPIPLPPKDLQVVRDKAGHVDGLLLPAVQVRDSDLSLPAVQVAAVQLPAGANGHLQALANLLENGASSQALATLLNRTFGLIPGAGPYR